jgi:hypothetical protein
MREEVDKMLQFVKDLVDKQPQIKPDASVNSSPKLNSEKTSPGVWFLYLPAICFTVLILVILVTVVMWIVKKINC